MPNFNLLLTGQVGSASFNSAETLRVLNQYPGKHVDVLIDSQGGLLSHGLSIADAFRSHGDVTAHMRGMCASAATIASMGAKKVTMAPDAFYLVHKVSMTFIEWASHNSDSLESFISELQKAKNDLDTLDQSVAATYAARCKKPVDSLLSLMKEGKWLTAQQALDWGLVDEITSFEALPEPPRITKAQADAFLAQGLPIPPVPVGADPLPDNMNFFKDFLSSLKSFFKMDPNPQHQNSNPNPQTAPQNNQQDPQNNPDQLTTLTEENRQLKNQIETLKAEKSQLENKVAELSKAPAADSADAPVNTTGKAPQASDDSPLKAFMDTTASANSLFNSLP